MKRRILRLLPALAAQLFMSDCFCQSPVWPDQKKAAIVLTYDDGLPTQLDSAAVQLEQAGLKATFYLTSDIETATIPRWRSLANKGFELGNHTLYHPCSVGQDVDVFSDHYTPSQMCREIDIMNKFLFAIDGQTNRTYAYPCTETKVGGGDYVELLRQLKLVSYARTGGDRHAIVTDFKRIDPLRVPALGVGNGMDAVDLIAYVDSVRSRGGLGVIMMHGIGGDYITISCDAHRKLLKYLAQHRDEIWVTTFREAMDYVYKGKGRAVSESSK